MTILSLILVNAQGVTALTSERDTGALDLLLVTELSPKEFIYGKLYGVLYNSKEMILLPVITAIVLAFWGHLSGENLVFFLIDFLLLCHFSAMLGLHSAITYTSSRTAVANSLGTIFFLMVGILLCSFLIALSDREFGRQLLSFMIFIGAGSVALFGSMGARNPSNAITLVAILTPFWTFYCIISLLNGSSWPPSSSARACMDSPCSPCSSRRSVISTSPWVGRTPSRGKRSGHAADEDSPPRAGS